MSGSQPGSLAVSGLPSVSASGMEVTGRHVTSCGWAPYCRLAVHVVIAVSAIAMFRRASRRLFLDIDS
jgi:hypothetical protein